jgi:three-Cys-motif partner protein
MKHKLLKNRLTIALHLYSILIMKEKDVKTNILPHTQAKLDLYKGYLEHYLRVLCHSEFCKKINLFDIYCGVGIYDDGKMGSPLLAIDCIKKIRTEMSDNGKPTTPISLLVNDNDAQKLKNVKDKIRFQDIDNFTIEYNNKDANEMLDIVADRILKYPKDYRNLIFIDPYGYSDINKDKIINLLKNNCTEIILFLPVMQMYRFTETAFIYEEKSHYENLRKFILSFFNNPTDLNNDSIFTFIQSIKRALSINDLYYTCSYYIERGKGSYYALFFICSNIYGLEKMLETKWSLDTGQGKGFKQNDNSMQLSMFDEELKIFDALQSISTLENIIYQEITQNGKLTNVRLYKLTLKNEFLPKHAIIALDNLIKKGKIQKINNSKGYGINYTNFKRNNIVSMFEVI